MVSYDWSSKTNGKICSNSHGQWTWPGTDKTWLSKLSQIFTYEGGSYCPTKDEASNLKVTFSVYVWLAVKYFVKQSLL